MPVARASARPDIPRLASSTRTVSAVAPPVVRCVMGETLAPWWGVRQPCAQDFPRVLYLRHPWRIIQRMTSYTAALAEEIRAVMGRKKISGRELARRVAATLAAGPAEAKSYSPAPGRRTSHPSPTT